MSDTATQLRLAHAAKTLMDQEVVVQAFDTIIANYKEGLFALQEGEYPDEILRVHFAIKSMMKVKERLEHDATAIEYYTTQLRAEQSR